MRTWAWLVCALAVGVTPAVAQYGAAGLIQPGQSLPATVLANDGGPAGRELAPLVGKRPVLIVYWRPRDPSAEQALAATRTALQQVAPDVVLFPVAILAAGQSPKEIGTQLEALGLKDLSPRQDGGQLLQVLGIKRVPSFALIDAGGVLRLVGGADISQNTPAGTSIEEAVVLAGKGSPVPTLGAINAQPAYKLLGAKAPDLAYTELDGKTFRKLSDLYNGDKKILLFFWLPSCSHCREALPKLRAWYEKTRPKDLIVLTLARAEIVGFADEARAFIKDYPFVNMLDIDATCGKQLYAMETPSVYLLSPKGEVLGIQTGSGIDWDKWLGSTPRPRSSAAAPALSPAR